MKGTKSRPIIRHSSFENLSFAVTPTGSEQFTQYSTFKDSPASAAPGAALGPDLGPIDPDLAMVVEAWPRLPEAVRSDIVSKVYEAPRDAPAMDTE
jgi:hypothetical protein